MLHRCRSGGFWWLAALGLEVRHEADVDDGAPGWAIRHSDLLQTAWRRGSNDSPLMLFRRGLPRGGGLASWRLTDRDDGRATVLPRDVGLARHVGRER
jgi:hypothetical protein